MLRGMTTINYHAVDLQAAAAWYGELLGVEPYYLRMPYYIEFRIGDFQHELGILGVPEPPAPSGVVTYWAVDDIEAAYARLLARGATAHEPPTVRGDGYITASVVDPFGNILGIMYNVHYLGIVAANPNLQLPEIKPDVADGSN